MPGKIKLKQNPNCELSWRYLLRGHCWKMKDDWSFKVQERTWGLTYKPKNILDPRINVTTFCEHWCTNFYLIEELQNKNRFLPWLISCFGHLNETVKRSSAAHRLNLYVFHIFFTWTNTLTYPDSGCSSAEYLARSSGCSAGSDKHSYIDAW